MVSAMPETDANSLKSGRLSFLYSRHAAYARQSPIDMFKNRKPFIVLLFIDGGS